MTSFAKKQKENIPDPKSSGHVRSPSRDQAHDARRRLRACPPRPRTVATMIVVRAASCSHKNCCWRHCSSGPAAHRTGEPGLVLELAAWGLAEANENLLFPCARSSGLAALGSGPCRHFARAASCEISDSSSSVITSHCNALSASCHNALCLSFLRPFVCVLMCMWLWVTSRSRQSALSTSAVPTSARAPTLSGQALAPTQPSDSMPAMPPRRSCRRATFPWVATALALSCALAACARSVSPPRPSRPAPPCLAPRCCFRA